jgi:hypothetical protein
MIAAGTLFDSALRLRTLARLPAAIIISQHKQIENVNFNMAERRPGYDEQKSNNYCNQSFEFQMTFMGRKIKMFCMRGTMSKDDTRVSLLGMITTIRYLCATKNLTTWHQQNDKINKRNIKRNNDMVLTGACCWNFYSSMVIIFSIGL